MTEPFGYSSCKMKCLLKIESEFPNMSVEQMHKIFNLAWDYGHSSGEVEIYLEQLLDLFR